MYNTASLRDTFQHRRHAMLDFLGKIRAHVMCLALGLATALPLALLTPPFQVPDEAQHFSRAYQISELSLWGINKNGRAGALLPSSIARLSDIFLGTRAIHAARPLTPRPLRTTLAAMAVPLLPEQREFVDFSGIAAYSPLPYVPQAVAIALARRAGADVAILFYTARLANAVAAILVLACAVRVLPLAKEAAMVTGLLPMALSLYASISPDALGISSAYLFTALSLRSLTDKKWTPGGIWMAALAGTIFTSLKVVYAPLLLLGLPALATNRRATLIAHAIIVCTAVGITLAWLSSIHDVAIFVREGTDAHAQLHRVLHYPGHFGLAVWRALLANRFYGESMIGVLGWLTLPLPDLAYVLPVVALVVASSLRTIPDPRLPLPTALWGVLIIIGSVLLVMTALYLFWTPRGYPDVEGVQGRYFLPLLALAGAILRSAVPVHLRLLPMALVLTLIVMLILVETGIMYLALIQGYHLFSPG